MKRKVTTVVLGALLLFIWNAVSWMVLPFHSNTLRNIPESSFDYRLLQEELARDGVYHYPGFPENSSPTNIESLGKKLKEGPRITLMVYKNGSTEIFDPKSFGLNFLFNLFTVILLLYIVNQIKEKSLKKIVLLTVSIGLIIGLMSDLPQMNWYMFPIDYTLINMLDHIISFLLLGLLFGTYTLKKLKTNE